MGVIRTAVRAEIRISQTWEDKDARDQSCPPPRCRLRLAPEAAEGLRHRPVPSGQSENPQLFVGKSVNRHAKLTP